MSVKTVLKAGKIILKHSPSVLKVTSGLKAGRISLNHSRTLL